MRRYYRADFGPAASKPWTRFVLFRHDNAPLHETLVNLAGNKISDVLIAEGSDPLQFCFGEPRQITAREYARTRGESA